MPPTHICHDDLPACNRHDLNEQPLFLCQMPHHQILEGELIAKRLKDEEISEGDRVNTPITSLMSHILTKHQGYEFPFEVLTLMPSSTSLDHVPHLSTN